MKSPEASDYDVRTEGDEVRVLFKPTETYYSFPAMAGRVSDSASVRHAKFGDTGDYIDAEVGALAFRLAQDHVRLLSAKAERGV